MERLDKIICVAAKISRKQAADAIKKGRVDVNGKCICSAKEKFDEKNDIFTLDNTEVKYNKFVYIMMNKPKGVISASEGKDCKTVVDILPDEMKRKNLFPAGRLDKDTTGFVLITDDGEFAHRILSPKNHIPKEYIAVLDKPFDDEIIAEFNRGIRLKDDVCMPAMLSSIDGDYTKALVRISQGMYHQIKRMFARFGITVLELKRIRMGGLALDSSLAEGASRYLTEKELEIIEKGQ